VSESEAHKPFGVFGSLPRELATPPAHATQFSPLHPGAAPLAACPKASLTGMTMLAPPGTIERRRALALALRALALDAELVVMAPKDKGGGRLAKELGSFGCDVAESVKHHHRICTARRPAEPVGLEDAMNEGTARFVDEIGFWSQPGIFSWDRIDPGSALLASVLPELAGSGADLGCGYGFLARAILRSNKVKRLVLVDIDGRAVEAARLNIEDPRAVFLWADIRAATPALTSLDFVVMNAPFHDGGIEDRDLGRIFIQRAAASLRKGGSCWVVANRHLPYEAVMAPLFKELRPVTEQRGFKVYVAVR